MGAGSSKAKVYTDNLLKVAVQSTTDVLQACKVESDATQLLNLSGNCSIKDSTFNWDQAVQLSLQCAQSSKVQNDIKLNLQEKLVQKATAEAPLLSLSATQTESFLKLHKDLATAFQMSVTQNCTAKNSSIQAVTCTDAAQVDNLNLNWKQRSQNFTTCAQKSEAVNQLVQEIQSVVEQHASSNTGNTYLWLGIGGVIGFALLITLIYFLAKSNNRSSPQNCQCNRN